MRYIVAGTLVGMLAVSPSRAQSVDGINGTCNQLILADKAEVCSGPGIMHLAFADGHAAYFVGTAIESGIGFVGNPTQHGDLYSLTLTRLRIMTKSTEMVIVVAGTCTGHRNGHVWKQRVDCDATDGTAHYTLKFAIS